MWFHKSETHIVISIFKYLHTYYNQKGVWEKLLFLDSPDFSLLFIYPDIIN